MHLSTLQTQAPADEASISMPVTPRLRARRDGPAPAAAAANEDSACKLHVRHVPFDMNGGVLRRIFEGVGRVADCFLQPDPNTGGHRGFATVRMKEEASALRAILMLNNFKARIHGNL